MASHGLLWLGLNLKSVHQSLRCSQVSHKNGAVTVVLTLVSAGMALATLFVTLPFVVRELIPILETMDLAEEEAARTMGASDWQVFWNVTLPNIRYGLLYGIVLTNAVS